MNKIKNISTYLSIILWGIVLFIFIINDFHITVPILGAAAAASIMGILVVVIKDDTNIDYWRKKYDEALNDNVEKARLYINARNMLEQAIYEHYKPIMEMTKEQMFEKSFERPSNYFKLSERQQWDIDSRLGILDWKGDKLTEEQLKRFNAHYDDNRKEK